MEQEEADEAHVAGQSLDNGPWQLGSSGGDTTDVKVWLRLRLHCTVPTCYPHSNNLNPT